MQVQYIDKKGFIHFGTAPSLEAVKHWMEKKGIKSNIGITGKDSVLISEQYSHCSKKAKTPV